MLTGARIRITRPPSQSLNALPERANLRRHFLRILPHLVWPPPVVVLPVDYHLRQGSKGPVFPSQVW